jgi:hypothetical protein
MRLSYFVGFALAAISASFASFSERIAVAAASVVDFVLSLVPAASPDMRLHVGYAAPMVPSLAGIDAALYHGNRHEAGVARRAAERHI